MNVFGNSVNKDSNKVYKAGSALLAINGMEAIATQIVVTYGRQVQDIPVIGRSRCLSVGEPTGTIQLNSLLTKEQDLIDIVAGDEGCTPYSMTITFTDSNCENAGTTITCNGCVTSQISLTMQGGQGYVAENINITFTNMVK